eukprot:Skav214328  [mRNA]  locus=scaffold86:211383:212986:+ [translate_table: standard]
MWTLFMAMNGDPGDMQPLFDAYPGTLVFAAGYMIFTSFAILSVLTGVVADKMATAAEEHSKEIEDEAQRKQDLHTEKYLERIFTAYSENGCGGITHKIYKEMIADEDISKAGDELRTPTNISFHKSTHVRHIVLLKGVQVWQMKDFLTQAKVVCCKFCMPAVRLCVCCP